MTHILTRKKHPRVASGGLFIRILAIGPTERGRDPSFIEVALPGELPQLSGFSSLAVRVELPADKRSELILQTLPDPGVDLIVAKVQKVQLDKIDEQRLGDLDVFTH